MHFNPSLQTQNQCSFQLPNFLGLNQITSYHFNSEASSSNRWNRASHSFILQLSTNHTRAVQIRFRRSESSPGARRLKLHTRTLICSVRRLPRSGSVIKLDCDIHFSQPVLSQGVRSSYAAGLVVEFLWLFGRRTVISCVVFVAARGLFQGE